MTDLRDGDQIVVRWHGKRWSWWYVAVLYNGELWAGLPEKPGVLIGRLADAAVVKRCNRRDSPERPVH